MEFELIVKKLKNELSPKEAVAFGKWYNASAKHRAYFAKVSGNYLKETAPVATDEAWKSISSKLNKDQKNQYWKIAIAASIIGIITLSGFLQLINTPPITNIPNAMTSSPIKIGDDKAILTLGNGTNIVLTNNTYQNNYIKSNGTQLIYDSINSQPNAEAIVYNYLTIPRGGEYFVKLSDGTKVWLNSDSKLKYPVRFSGTSRKVELIYGEAYFEVSPSTLHDGANFIVATQNQVVEVLGTEFNIKAYQEDAIIATTLVEGKVSLTNSATQQQEYLMPNQQLKLNTKTNKVSIQQVDPENIVSWKNGFFKFKNTSLKEIMIVLSRWYDMDVAFKDKDLKKKKFNGVFSKKQQIENILEAIQKTREAAFKIEGEKILIEDYTNKTQSK